MTKFMDEVRQTVIDYKEAAVEYAKPFSTVDIGEIYFLAGKFAGMAERLIAIDDVLKSTGKYSMPNHAVNEIRKILEGEKQ